VIDWLMSGLDRLCGRARVPAQQPARAAAPVVG
jgi:hypothetical protein